MAGLAIERIEAELAKERQGADLRTGNIKTKLPESSKSAPQARDRVAKAVGANFGPLRAEGARSIDRHVIAQIAVNAVIEDKSSFRQARLRMVPPGNHGSLPGSAVQRKNVAGRCARGSKLELFIGSKTSLSCSRLAARGIVEISCWAAA